MKIAVYTIALNEEKYVQEWYDSAKDADYLLIADTGSTDKTKRLAKKLGINVIDISIKPWRFDDARNAALAALPDDIDMCISLDMDEVLVDGWREHVEKSTGTQLLYKYTWSWRDDKSYTQPQTVFIANKIHARHGYRWNYLVHELPLPDRNPNHAEEYCDVEIHHHPDLTKPRSSYDAMIEDAYKQDPTSDRYAFYNARTLIAKDKKEAIKELKKFIKMPKRQTSEQDLLFAYYILSIIDKRNTVKHLERAIEINPEYREAVVALAKYYFKKKDWDNCIEYCEKALKITVRKLEPNYQEFAWGYLANNMLVVAKNNRKGGEQLPLNVDTLISSSFELYKEEDVL